MQDSRDTFPVKGRRVTNIVNASKKNPFERIPNLRFKKREEDDDTTTSIRRTSWRWSRRCQFNLPPCCGWKNFRWPTNFPLLCLVPATAVLRVFLLSFSAIPHFQPSFLPFVIEQRSYLFTICIALFLNNV